jgi:hypothetical protein
VEVRSCKPNPMPTELSMKEIQDKEQALRKELAEYQRTA